MGDSGRPHSEISDQLFRNREEDVVVVFEGCQLVVQWIFEGLHEWAHVAEIAEPARCCLQLFQVNLSAVDGHLNVPRNVSADLCLRSARPA